MSWMKCDWNKIKITKNKVNIDIVFVYNISLKMINDNEDHDPKSIKDCRQS